MMFHSSLTVLVVDGQSVVGECSCQMLNAEAERLAPIRTVRATTISETLTIIASTPVDVVLLDPLLVDTSMLDAVRRLRDAAPDLPIVIITDATRESLAFEGVQAGAQDYVIKGVDDSRVLHRALRHAVERASIERRSTFLANAGAVLGSSLDARATLATTTRLAVPTLGDRAVGFIVTEDGTLEPVEPVNGQQPMYERLLAAARVIATRGDVATVTDVVVDARHCMLVPLSARGRVLGVLGLVASKRTRRYTPADLSLVQAFAARAAIAMDNARLYEASRRATRTRDQVLGIVSHDLRNPLSAIGMCAAALRDDSKLTTTERRRLVGTIRDSVDWTQRLLADLLDIASVEAGRLSVEPRPIDPIVVVSRALDLFELSAEGRVVQLADDVPDTLPTIMGDEQRILQVLANLIANALKFTAPEGRVTLGAVACDDDVMFRVSDTGPGIAPEHLAHIFDWFWRASHERAQRGTGLGLAIAKGIVDAHGGRLTVDSPPGRGATFSFTIPRTAQSTRRAPELVRQAERVPA